MILFNTTFHVSLDLAPDWVHWMKETQLPAIMETGLPSEHRLLHLLTELDNGGKTYSCQLNFTTMAAYEVYKLMHHPVFQRQLYQKFTNQYVEFETLLEDISAS